MSDRERRVPTPPDAQARALSAQLRSEGAATGPDPLACSSDPGLLDSDEAISADGRQRRMSERFEVTWSVDCATEDTFLFAAITNISEMGIFVKTIEPLAVGTALTLRFAPDPRSEPFILRGTVAWVNELRPLHDNPNPGMGICFSDLLPGDRERIVETIHTIAYLRDVPSN